MFAPGVQFQDSVSGSSMLPPQGLADFASVAGHGVTVNDALGQPSLLKLWSWTTLTGLFVEEPRALQCDLSLVGQMILGTRTSMLGTKASTLGQMRTSRAPEHP